MRMSRFSEEQIEGILKEHAAGEGLERQDYNEARPHGALGYQAPSAFAPGVARVATSLPEREGRSSCGDQALGAALTHGHLCTKCHEASSDLVPSRALARQDECRRLLRGKRYACSAQGCRMIFGSSKKKARTTVHVAHQHLLGVINTESVRFGAGQVVRLLDAGCGNCRLLAFLAENLPRANSTVTYEFYGFDVHDFWPIENFGEAIDDLTRQFPGISWRDRISRIPMHDRWPYPDAYFDVIISNQVGEHLNNPNHFVSEVARCLAPTGFSANLFPLKHVIMEWHVLVPFAHRIKNFDVLKAFIAACARAGWGAARRRAASQNVKAYAASQAEFVIKYTHYLSYGELLTLSKKHGLLLSMRYTKEFYTQKIRRILTRPVAVTYSRKRSLFGDWLLVFLLRYVQGITVVLEKGGHFRPKSH